MMQTDPYTPHLSEAALHAWLDGALDARARAEADAHLAACAACTADLAQLRHVAAMLHEWPDIAPERDFSASVLAAIAPQPVALSRRWRIVLAAQIAGALVAGGGLASALQNGLPAQALPAMDVLAPLNTLGSWVITLATRQYVLVTDAAASTLQMLSVPLFSMGICLSIAGVAWIIVNSTLLRDALSAHTGKNS